ncbi:hypothetical protein AB6Q85_002334 [Vibrio cholerae]
MNILQFLSSYTGYFPKWLVTICLLIAVPLTILPSISLEDLNKLSSLSFFGSRGFNLTLPKSDLEYVLLATQSEQVGVWSHSYYVPESKSLTAEIRKDISDHPNITKQGIPVYDTPNQSLQHWSLRCYSGIPELRDLQNSGINYIISCPITTGSDVNKQTLGGFLQVEFKDKPKETNRLVGEISRYTKTYKFN